MSYTQYLDSVQKIYMAYYQRPADSEGLIYWAQRLDLAKGSLEGIIDAFATSEEAIRLYGPINNDTIGNVIDSIYLALFDRLPDVEGKTFYMAGFAEGRFTSGSIALDILNGAKNQDADAIDNKLEASNYFTQAIDPNMDGQAPFLAEYDSQDEAAARAWLAEVTSDPNTQKSQEQVNYEAQRLLGAGNIFTLTESVVEGEDAVAPVTAVYWGYTPHQHGDNDANDVSRGIPVEDLVSFLTTITGLDLTELGLIDDDGVGPFDNVTSLTIKNALSLDAETKIISEQDAELDQDADDDSLNVGGNANLQVPILNITYTDGTSQQFNIEAQIGEQYFAFLNNLLFDEDGNSRLFEVVVEEGEEATEDTTQPIKLTPKDNNGGTVEQGFTTSGNDLIVAGRLELLHGAYIDADGGYNVLEVDAKGTFAQPLALLNIQEIRVQNLNNAYTERTGGDHGDGHSGDHGDGHSGDGGGYESTYPDLPNSGSGNSLKNSILDLSRAVDIEKLIISEGDFKGSSDCDGSGSGSGEGGSAVKVNLGALTIVGIRNGAETTLDGGFSRDVTLHYSVVSGDGVNLVFNNVDFQPGAYFNVAQNADTLNIKSIGGGNTLNEGFLGGQVSTINITGDASLFIAGDLGRSLHMENPITIDASANTGGVNLNLAGPQNVTFKGSQGNDIFKVDTWEGSNINYNNTSVTIIGGAGDNFYVIDETYRLDITDGDGNNNYEIDDAIVVTITAGNGNNHFEIDDVASATLAAGDGDNKFEVYAWEDDDTAWPDDSLDYPNTVNITAGDGKNIIDVDGNDNIALVTIAVGAGGNDIDATAHEVNIATDGAAANTIKVLADIITIDNSASVGSSITLGGFDFDYIREDELGGNSTEGHGAWWAWSEGDNGALLKVNAGTDATIILGSDTDYQDMEDNDFPGESTITAIPGSEITGENITLFVKTEADLRAATLSGIAEVIMDDDNGWIGSAPTANEAVAGFNASVLTLTAAQFAAIGAENFSVDGAIFNTHSFVKIIVTDDTSLTALGVDELPRNIDLLLEIQDGATLTMTAEQLHTRVAQKGVTLANDGNTDEVSGKVIITGGGFDFDPFNTSDTVQTIIDGRVYYGGSLSRDFKVDGEWYNVQVKSMVNGYDRPADAAAEVYVTLDSTGLGTMEQGGFSTWHYNLEIIGDQDIQFTGPVALGLYQGEPSTLFTVDYSALEAQVINFTLDNFEAVKAVYGNSDKGYPSEVYVQIAADDYREGSGEGEYTSNGFGWDEPDAKSLVSEGVTKYIVSLIEGPTAPGSEGSTATIKLCDTTKDLEVMALRGNYNDTLNIVDAAWGLAFELQGGTTAKADGPTGTANVGCLVANYMWDGADAVVSIVHSVAGDTRPIYAAGVEINNADSITIDVTGSAVIEEIDGNSVEELAFSATGDVEVIDELPDSLTDIDAAGVVGTFEAAIDSPDGDFSFIGAQGGSTLHLMEFTASDETTIDGGAAGVELVIGGEWHGDDDVDLSAATLINVTKVILDDDAELSLTMAQADAIGAANFVLADDADNATLNLYGLNGEPFAIANYADGIEIGVLTIAGEAGDIITLHPDTNLTGVAGLRVPEGVTLNLTAAQFQQLGGWAFPGPEGWGSIRGIDGTTDFTVNITGLTQADVDNDLTGDGDSNDQWENLNLSQITADKLTISLAEDVKLEEDDDLGNAEVIIGDGMTLTLADIQQADGRVIGGGTNTTLKFMDLYAGAFESIDASNFNVDTLMILNVLVADRNVDLMFMGLPESVDKVVFNDLGWVEGVTQNVIVQEGVTIPGWIVFNKPEADVEIRYFNLTLAGGTEIDGNLRLSASEDEEGLLQTDLQSVTINSLATPDDPATPDRIEGTNLLNGKTGNIINGDITSQGTGSQGSYTSVDNDLLNVTINAEESLLITGQIEFESVVGNDEITANDDDEAVATLTITGTADVTIGQLDVDDVDIETLYVINNGTGTLNIVGDSPAIDGESWADADYIENLVFAGTGNIVLGSEDNGYEGVEAEDLSLIDASALSGDLNLGELVDIDSADFSFIAGTGVTKLTLTDDNLDSTGDDGIAGNADDTAGWNFDFTNAAAGSEFHLAPDWIPADFIEGSVFTINLGANTTLFIDETMELSGIDLEITGDLPIVLAPGVTLTITAALADGLSFVPAPGIITDPLDPDYDPAQVPVVNITELGEAVYDLSGIDPAIAGKATLAEDDDDLTHTEDVTLAEATDLGALTIELMTNNDNTDLDLSGQTIRFQTVEQAERAIVVVGDDDDGSPNSTNVVWLFTDITAPVETKDYDKGIGRLWVMDQLVDGESGDVEDLFTTLPSSVLRVEFKDVEFLNALLASVRIDRTVELVSFMELGNLTANDAGINPDEHVRNLTIKMGGQVQMGNIVLDDVIDAAKTDPTSVAFDTLTIDSYRALSDEHFLAAELYVNDNDGGYEEGEHVLPANVNTVGNIGVGGALSQIDLLDVKLNTYAVSVEGTGLAGSLGADLNVGTITFDSESVDDPDTLPVEFATATLTVTGDNDINIAQVNTDDADIDTLTVDATGYTGTLTAPGTSPAFQLNNTEYLIIKNDNVPSADDAGTITLGSETNAGVAGNELSFIDASGFDGTLNLGVVALIDGTNDDRNDDGDTIDPDDAAFAFDSGSGLTTMTLGSANGLTPTLVADSEWKFDFSDAAAESFLTITEDVIFQAGGILTLIDVPLIISGDVDLSEVVLNLPDTDDTTPGVQNATTIWVPLDCSLTLSVDQVLLLNSVDIDVTGSGTTKIVGDATAPYDDGILIDNDPSLDLDDFPLAAALGTPMNTAIVDVSGVTIDLANDLGGGFSLFVGGGVDDEGADVAQRIVGSLNNDVLGSISDLDDTLEGGTGNDVLYGFLSTVGSDTYVVSSGSDVIFDLEADDPADSAEDWFTQDVLTVQTGATAYGLIYDEFYATAGTTNEGTAILIGSSTTIDVSLAGGSKGFTLIGNATSSYVTAADDDYFDYILGNVQSLAQGRGGNGGSTLIGSGQADIINGGNDEYSSGAIDVLTGNAGADKFVFNVLLGGDLVFTQETTTAAKDEELITITADGADENNEVLTITYKLGGASSPNSSRAVTLDTIDVTSAEAVANAVATALNGQAGIGATADGSVVHVTGDNGAAVQIVSVAASGTVTTLAGAISNGTDVAQVTTLTLSEVVTEGDIYSVEATLKTGDVATSAPVNVVAGDTLTTVAGKIVTAFSYPGEITESSLNEVVTFTDADPDNGGFTLSTDLTEAGFAGSGASDLLTGTEADLDTADIITDFNSADDALTFGLAAGSGDNYKEAAEAANYVTAYNSANTALDGTVMYYFTSIQADLLAEGTDQTTGLLFFDANMDGDADGVVALLGVDQDGFAAADIVAA